MKQYSRLINKSKDGKHLDKLSDGLLLLVLVQAVTSVSTNSVSLIAQHVPSWLATLTIVNNYFVLLLTGISLAIIGQAANRLINLVPKKSTGYEQPILMIIFIAFSSIYSYLIINQPIHASLAPRSYYMSNSLVLLTIAIPYLFIWYMGLRGSYHLFYYQKKVKGLIYKKSLAYVSAGIAFVVMSSIAVRFLTTISAQINRLKLTPVLLIIYGFLGLIGLGFILIGYGAKKLRRIEEV